MSTLDPPSRLTSYQPSPVLTHLPSVLHPQPPSPPPCYFLRSLKANSSADFKLLTWLRGRYLHCVPNHQSLLHSHPCVDGMWEEWMKWGTVQGWVRMGWKGNSS